MNRILKQRLKFSFKIFITALLTLIIFLILGEFWLRYCTYYGIYHCIKVHTSSANILEKEDFLFEDKLNEDYIRKLNKKIREKKDIESWF